MKYNVGDFFTGPSELPFRIVAIWNDKYIIRIFCRDGVKTVGMTSDATIDKYAKKIPLLAGGME